MDRNANLKEQLQLALRLDTEGEYERTEHDRLCDGQRLAELVLTLDAWLANGGFLPSAWAKR